MKNLIPFLIAASMGACIIESPSNTDSKPCASDTVYVYINGIDSQVVDPIVDAPITTPTNSIGDYLGVVITPASDKLITGVPDQYSRAFKHVRYMASGYWLRSWQKPSESGPVNLCISPNRNVWQECEVGGMRDAMDRMYKLRDQFGEDATITYVNEYFLGDDWPRKTLLYRELVRNPRGSSLKEVPTLNSAERQEIYDIYYQEYDAVLRSLNDISGDVVLEVMNENWGADYKEISEIQYLAAQTAHIDAVEEYGCDVRLSSGPRQWNRRTFNFAGPDPLAESILDVPPSFLKYLDETEGVVSINFYPSNPPDQWGNVSGDFVSHENWDISPDWIELDKLADFLEEKYPNIQFNVSETGYTSSPQEVMPTQAQRLADRPYIRNLIDRCLDVGVDIIYVYQIDEHGVPEGKFTGTAVSGDIEWWSQFSQK